MTATVHKLQLVEVGEGFRFDSDEILEGAKGVAFTRLLVVGEIDGEDDLYVAGNCNAGETMILMEIAKLQLLDVARNS